jgi:DNA replication and repair protein RecF
MLLVIGPPTLRRTALDQLAAPHDPMYGSHLSTYTRALAQRNSLLRQIRDGEADRAQLRYWDEPFLASGAAIVAARLRLLELLSRASGGRPPRDRPRGGAARTRLRHERAAAPRGVAARRAGPPAGRDRREGSVERNHSGRPASRRPGLRVGGRDLTTFASRGQQRTAILALKLAELDLLTALDGRPRSSCSTTSSASWIRCAAATSSGASPSCRRR